ncbi:sensor histidine kinase [Candidatus Viridilinea mediisalina]|uniref:histidine kinase n=1 Tax=Candidatus Viridilinea mediisalina TaxID=2024553 RepID=A0A2A6RDC3_9CHLR|nr:ATP-binding protein [Candidatus Viridilinea mediisalina]PDV98331.1 hypothetical protein CJ255_21990 [Candidatus Viridilinea mediisalina]
MLNELFDISRIEQGQLTIRAVPLDLSALLLTLVNAMQPDMPRHTLHTSGLELAQTILGDEVRLIQVFENLIKNAVKYSPFGGNVWIKLEASSNHVQVSVRDEGIGIPTVDLPHLFQCFYRASNSGRWRIAGTGIGLYVVAEILRRHGASIRVQSIEGAGSDFVVQLPLVDSG